MCSHTTSTQATPLASALRNRVAACIAQRLGLHYPENRRDDLEQRLQQAAAELHMPLDGFAAAITTDALTASAWDVLADHLAIGETYFFREMRTLGALESEILPALAKRAEAERRGLRIWSAGCCTGEEPYTLAIMLHRAGLWRPGKGSILATDFNPRFLERAQEGRYRQWSFRGAPEWLWKYVETMPDQAESGSRYRIIPSIREMVRFEQLNLAHSHWPDALFHDFDLIVCRNVLLYFNQETMRDVASRFYHRLIHQGWLATAPAEAAHVAEMGLFTPVRRQGALLFQRDGAVQRDIPPPESPHALPGEATALMGDAPELKEAAPAAADEIPSPPPREAVWDPTAVREALERDDLPAAAARLEAATPSETTTEPWVALVASLAERLADMDQLDAAAHWVSRGLAVAALDAGLYHLQGVVHMAQGDAHTARQAWRRALYLDPELVMTRYLLMHLERAAANRTAMRQHGQTLLKQLQALPPEGVAPHAEGLSVARMRELVEHVLFME